MADVLFLVSVVLLAAGSTPPALLSTPPPSSGCADELVAFSPCLPYISDSPNNISDSPPVQCCDNFAAAFDDNTAICLCYLVHNPQILGFPINSTKLISLTSVCPVKEKEGEENLSLESLCSGSTMLPPFRAITDHRGSSSGPRRPSLSPSPSPSPRPTPRIPHPGDHDNPSPQEPPGQGNSSPPSSDVDDNPSPAAQATPSCASTIAIRILSYHIGFLIPILIFLFFSECGDNPSRASQATSSCVSIIAKGIMIWNYYLCGLSAIIFTLRYFSRKNTT
ncbi:non-specific lipid transfer protein GPI-anchored 25 isoform X2 [Nicotiana tomentosiformis]|uniref:non-specific lipid transfer protein GPI-anchored 25 isoform X2 n=1 Tax=Nicotiana tomentosiformis TaxID=4098 RepID=UPI00051B2AA1